MSPATNTTGKGESTRKPSSASQPPVKCPRCDSPNTKFCYYNNYSLTQPRHFCKTCRRYWTKGGALRNVPIGGGCRKNKKLKPSPRLPAAPPNNIIFHHHFPSFDNSSPSNFNLDPSPMGFAGGDLGFSEMGNNLATSIESLSSINQDLHWKLQQQRLATLFVQEDADAAHKEPSGTIQKPHPIQFHSLQENPNSLIGRKDGSFSNTDCFLNSSPPAANFNANWSAGIQAWTELSHYTTSLP